MSSYLAGKGQDFPCVVLAEFNDVSLPLKCIEKDRVVNGAFFRKEAVCQRKLEVKPSVDQADFLAGPLRL